MKGSMEKGGMAIKGKILKVVPIILVLAIVFGCAVDELETNVPESPDARVAVATQEEIASHSPEEQTAEKQTAEKKSPENEEHQPSLERSSFRHIQSPGYAELIDVSDGVAGWTSRDIVIKVVDVTNPTAPRLLGTIDTPQFAQTVYANNQYLYLGDKGELRIVSLSNPFAEPIGRYTLDGFWPEAMTVNDGRALLASGNQLLILDVSDPAHPRRLSQMQLTGMAPTEIFVRNGYAYIVESLGGLNIVDIRNLEQPALLKVLPFESHTVGFRIQGDYGYLARIVSVKPASTTNGYESSSVIEVIDLATATVIGSVTLPSDVRGLDANGDTAFVLGSYPYRLTPIDIRVPGNPTRLEAAESITGNSDLQDIVLAGTYAYLADGMSGLRIVDVSNPTKPIHVKDIDLEGRAFRIHRRDNTLFIAVEQKYLHFADVRKPEVARLDFSERYIAAYPTASIVLKDKKAYVTTSSFTIYDVSNPVAPKKLNSNAPPVDSIQVQGTYLYSTIGEIGLLVYDLSNPVLPREVTRAPFPEGIPRDLSVDGKWAVGISNVPYSISLFDISQPANPVAGKSYRFSQYPNRVFVKGDFAYVARGSQGVDIFEIKDGTFQLVKNLLGSGYAHGVTVFGNRAYVIREGVEIYDVTDPRVPQLLNRVKSEGETTRAAVDNGYLFIADGFAGMGMMELG